MVVRVWMDERRAEQYFARLFLFGSCGLHGTEWVIGMYEDLPLDERFVGPYLALCLLFPAW